jgi:lysophospholipase L1-like esterase
MLSTRRKVLYGFFTSIALVVGADLLFRGYLLIDSNLGQMVSEHRTRNAPEIDIEEMIEPHPYFVYTHSTLRSDVNSWGFNFDELPLEKPKDTIRIVCLGGSTTAGKEAWPYWLERNLEQKGMKVEVLNFGVQAWTSAESLSALMFLGLDFSPDHVLVHHTNNDAAPLMAHQFRPDYAHYRRPIPMDRNELGALRVRTDLTWAIDSTLMNLSSLYVYGSIWLRGMESTRYTLNYLANKNVLVGNDPKPNMETFKRNLEYMATLSEAKGAKFWVVTMPRDSSEQIDNVIFDQMNASTAEWAKEEGWGLIELHTQEWDDAWFADPIHLFREGEQQKGQRIADVLMP